ncbi:MobF family relaxase [Nocardiopsis halophila]|uniref:MobF family relaxase n=1 Tax=Nocardiopsis halophila TaxID=141692 RepID=UPI0003461F29|nr:MobF family relaxase [Nocardiopsis halophila]
MSNVTKLGPDAEQVDYRLSQTCGESRVGGKDAVVNYRLKGVHPIERIGDGWHEFGLAPRTVLEDAAAVEAVRTIMAGSHPETGEVLVAPKMAAHPESLLPAHLLVAAVRAEAERRGKPVSVLLREQKNGKHKDWAFKRFERLENGLQRDGAERHRAPVADLQRVAHAAGVSLEEVYEAEELAHARSYADERVRVGNRGYDVTIDFPKSENVLAALADETTAARVEEIHLEAVRRAVTALESWCAYGLSGHQGEGRAAKKVDTSGFIGTITWHRTARPVDGTPGDPHGHAHVMLANMVYCDDGEWRTVAAGGIDLFFHAPAVGELARALSRNMMRQAFPGLVYQRDAKTGRWEIEGIGPSVRRVYSRRSAQVEAEAGEGASVTQKREAARRTAAAKKEFTRDEERASWHERARQARIDPERLVHEALRKRPPDSNAAAPGPPGPQAPDPDAVAARVWDPEHGVTSARKVTKRAKILAAVADACQDGVSGQEQLEELTDVAQGDARAVRMPKAGASHLANSERFTSKDVEESERTITGSAVARLGEGAGTVPAVQVERVLKEEEQRRGHALSAEQEAVVRRLVGAGHGVEALTGVPGSGKTNIMATARAAWQAAGLTVAGGATAAVAAANLSAQADIESRTLASWQHAVAEHSGMAGVDVLIIDEGAMVSDRALALVVQAAEVTGTKVVAIGDPKQLRPVGAGGAFQRLHELVGGPHMTGNRRQRDPVDRAALSAWREGAFRSALDAWNTAGRVHVSRDLQGAYDQIAQRWWADRSAIADAHEAVSDLLVMATYNEQVDLLNARMRRLARENGLLGSGVEFPLLRGGHVEMAVGDQVRVRANDYRARRGEGDVDVLNGFRGVVVAVDPRLGAQVEWRHAEQVQRAWMAPADIAEEKLTHGYALTIASAQGLTARRIQLLGQGASANDGYSAASRGSERVDWHFGAAELENTEERARLGAPKTGQERTARTLQSYAQTLSYLDEGMVTDELDKARKGRRAGPVASEDAAPQWRPLDEKEARAGRGPASQAAQERIAALQEQADEAAQRVRRLDGRRQELQQRVEQAGGWFRRRERRGLEEELGRTGQELSEARADLAQARRGIKQTAAEAVRADVEQARTETEHFRRMRLEAAAAAHGVSVEEAERLLPPAELDAALGRGLRARPGGAASGPSPGGEGPGQAPGHGPGPAEHRPAPRRGPGPS